MDYDNETEAEFDELVGRTIKAVRMVQCHGDYGQLGDLGLEIETVDGPTFRMYHDQDCCESVSLIDGFEDLQGLVGGLVALAEETHPDIPAVQDADWLREPESFTWTFYKIQTTQGDATLRWYGESNGYYSESVSFYRVLPEDP